MDKKTSKYSIASLVLGISSTLLYFLGFIIGYSFIFLHSTVIFDIAGYILRIGIISAPLAIIFGVIALRDIKKNMKKGKGFAITGIILGVIQILILIYSFILAKSLAAQL